MKSILLLFLVLCSCQSTAFKKCKNLNWRDFGRASASLGLNKNLTFLKQDKSCQNYKVPSDRLAYEEGYQDGLKFYCSTKSGFDSGKNGINYEGICPKHKEFVFFKGYYKGRIIYLERRLKETQKLSSTAQDRLWRKEREYTLLQSEDPELAKLQKEMLEAYREESVGLSATKESLKDELALTKKLYEEIKFK